MSGCSILRQQPVKMFHLSSGDPFVLCVCVCVCVSGRLGRRVCQDAPSFGNSLSRCSIFRQVTLLSSVCVCVCVWVFGSSCMSGCSILWQQPVKMFHLSSGDPFVLRVYMCVCVWAFGSLCMSGCSILWQQPVKMFHLSSSDPFVVCVCLSTTMFVCICQHLCVSEGDGWVYIQCICFVSVTKTRDFF